MNGIMNPINTQFLNLGWLPTLVKKIDKQINHPYHLDKWPQRIESFKPGSDFDKEILQVAKNAYQLYCDFPHRKFYDNIFPDLMIDGEDCITTADQYLSFCMVNIRVAVT